MDWVADAIDSFGRSAGIDGLRLDRDDCLSLEIEGDRMLTLRDLARSGCDEVLVIMRAPMPHPHGSAAFSALALADFRAGTGVAPQLALDDEDLVATLRMPRYSFLHSTLDEAVAALFDFHARVSRAEMMTR